MTTDWAEIRQSLMTPRMVAWQRLANISDLMINLEDSLNSYSQSTLSCPTCRGSVPTSGTRSRQTCPSCGSFYNINQERRNLRLELPHIDVEPRIERFSAITSFRFRTARQSSQNTPTKALNNILTTTQSTNGENSNDNNNMEENREETSPTPSCFGARIRRSKNTDNKDNDESYFNRNFRLGSGASLPPIRNAQTVRSRRSSAAPISGRISRSEERLPSSRNNQPVVKENKPNYPTLNILRHEIMNMVKTAKETKRYAEIKKFYFFTFESYANICATFKRDPEFEGAKMEEPGLKMELVQTVNDLLKELPSPIQKHFLKAVINSLIEEKPHLFSKDRVRALFIILQSPMFLSQSSYNVLAHVLRTITELTNSDHQLLVAWCKTMEVSRFRLVIGFVTQFITVRQFPPPDRSLPPLSSSKWWIPTATKVLAILYASNVAARPPLVHYTEFYNHTLDHLELMLEYRRWQTPERSDTFSYCQYPFVLSIVAKRFILTKDAEQQMILVARRSLLNQVNSGNQRNQRFPQIDIFFLNINVRRDYLVEDSLREISARKGDLKKKLRVNFEGEPGLDMGGLTKEWFMLLIKQVFKPESKMFVYYSDKRLYWFSMNGGGSLKEYNLIGVLMGLAVYNSIILDIRLPSICYRKLLSPPVVPRDEVFPVGLAKEPSIADLAEIMPGVAHGLRELLKYDGNVEEDMCLTFQVSLDEYGNAHTFNLKEKGEEIPVTNENRDEFVRLYLEWILNTAIYEQFRAFYLGFHTVTASNALIMLRPEEVEMLVCGCPTLDLNELKKVTEYDGYDQEHPTVRWFWQVLKEWPIDQQKQFLLFTTGSDRIPVGGMGEMQFKISMWRGQTKMLPQAHTCFNQLVLPPYGDKETLKMKLNIAVSNAEGFGLE